VPQPSAKGAKEAVRSTIAHTALLLHSPHPCHAPCPVGAMSPAAHEKKIGKARKGLELVSFLVAHKEKKYFVQLRHSQKITACFRRAKIYTLLFFIIFLNLSI